MNHSFVLLNEATGASPLASQVTSAWLASVAGACTVQLDRDVSPNWGGSYSVRAGSGPADVAPGEIVFALVDVLPDAPGAIAYHDVDGNAVPVAYLALSTCGSLDDVSVAISHECCETAGDPGCNRWADDGTGSTEYALELCDAVESAWYVINGVRVSDFLLPAFFVRNARGPYSYLASTGGNDVGGPFTTAMGGYQIKRSGTLTETQVNGSRAAHRAAKTAHWSSRATRRGARR